MVIAKPEWFKRRKYSGWGVSIGTWQGAVYSGVLALVLLVLITIAVYSGNMIFIIAFAVLFSFSNLDIMDVMWKLKKDERERMHEAIAERNSAWGMMLILNIGLIIEITYNILQNRVYVDPFIILALVVGIIIQSVTNYRLEKED
ncbi:hypothetical protein [Methanobacterium paludis]|uniref:DUF3796 domain-containing protein n=1 Tax=Methanobacterium paludis (strain DSM 25820 / JCM 18151 / SWAN1) TaxID=868131 RepID=F6D5X1_METPW|nr:hypothetical protein [Methanobacterium paludis]AEG19341.1 hypothetical protein MSWAN_2336 [Methanobacterium paludis]